MVPNPIVLRSTERRGSEHVIVLEEKVGEASIVRAVVVDQLTFESIQRIAQTHPFPRKRPEDDVVLFKGFATPFGTDQRYLGFQIVNTGSRHHTRIGVTPEAFDAFKAVFASWCARMEARRQAQPKS